MFTFICIDSSQSMSDYHDQRYYYWIVCHNLVIIVQTLPITFSNIKYYNFRRCSLSGTSTNDFFLKSKGHGSGTDVGIIICYKKLQPHYGGEHSKVLRVMCLLGSSLVLYLHNDTTFAIIGGSKGGRQGRAPPLGVQILSFSCSFRQKIEK